MSASFDFDVVIIGAGISGINAAYRIQNQGPPGMKYVILEGRDSIGGTVSKSQTCFRHFQINATFRGFCLTRFERL